MKRGKVVDLFAGGGGVSTGIEAALRRPVNVAVNHWNVAIAVHKANHPRTRHYISDVWKVNPREAIGDSDVWLLWASPDCTHHSVARGGKPRQQKLRTLPWSVVRWVRQVRPELIIVENVPEFRNWGPLKRGKPIKERAGETFRAWVRKLERQGYTVDHRVLNAADYGVPTRRKRLFIVARRDGQPIAWPKVTHGSKEACESDPSLLPYRTAAECIDWTRPCPSIFDRKKPLAEKTLRRIALGILRFVLNNPEPFLIRYNTGDGFRGQGTDEPLSTVDASNRFGLVAPNIIKVNHGKNDPRGEAINDPLSTVTAGRRGHALVAAHLTKFQQNSIGQDAGQPLDTVLAGAQRFGVVEPFLVRTAHGEVDRRGKRRGRGSHPVTEPIPTLPASNDFAVAVPHLISIDQQGSHSANAPADAPLHTVVTKNRSALVSAFLAKHYGGVVGVPLGERPLDTVTAKDHHALTAATLVKLRGECHGSDVADPAPTITASGNHIAQVQAFLTTYYGNDGSSGQDARDPMRTITAKARLGLVTIQTVNGPVDYRIVDIGMRMLEPDELLRATFGKYADGYDLSAAKTKEAQVRLIGNAVPPELVEAVVRANTQKRTRARPRPASRMRRAA